MANMRGFAWWLSGTGSLLAMSLGCSAIIGLQPVPDSSDGGPDATLPDGAHPGDAHHHDGKPGTDTGSSGSDSAGGSDSSSGGTDGSSGGGEAGASVVQYHNNLARDGHYVDPAFTAAYAGGLKLDTTFGSSGGAAITGPLWGQPLYVQNGIGGQGTIYVADDSNDVYAIDEKTGSIVKSLTPLKQSAGQAGSGCGNVNPVGVTSAPYIDLSSRTMYLAAAVGTGSGIMTFEIHALSIDDLKEVSGWPVDVSTITSSSGVAFNPPPQGQRGGLTLVNGYLYVAWGGEDGDCGDYHGWVVSVPVATPKSATGYTTAARGGGMWAVGGLASDGTDVFSVSGNATGGSGSNWANFHSEAVIRFHDGTAFNASKTTDFFAPSNWQSLDGSDTDLVGASPLVLDVPGATPSALVAAFGKSGVMHLLDRKNLGGVGTGDGTNGEGLYSAQIGSGNLRGAATSYTTSSGTYVVVYTEGSGTSCPGGGGNLVAVKVTATNPPKFNTVWCANSGGSGSPIVTTTDAAGSNPIVWVVGAEGSNQLTGWDGVTGKNVFNGGGISMDGSIHWTTPIVANGRVIVGANDKIYALTGK